MPSRVSAQYVIHVERDSSEKVNFNPAFIVDSLQKVGYLLADYKVFENKDKIDYQFSLNHIYKWNKLKSNIKTLDKLQNILANLNGKPANQFSLTASITKLIAKEYHNKGYPFAKVELVITDIEHYQVDAMVSIDKGPYIQYDSLKLNNQVIKKSYLSSYLNLNYKKPWSSKDYIDIEKNLKSLKFIALTQPVELNFSQKKANIQLFLEKQVSNQVDALVGIIPNENQTIITGQADIHLTNLFRSAITSDLKWRKYDQQSQALYTAFRQFKSFGTSLGFNMRFDLLKQDSSFINIDYELLTNYLFRPDILFSFGFQNTIANSQLPIDQVQNLPLADAVRSNRISSVKIGLEIYPQNNYPQLKDFFYLNTQISLGRKRIIGLDALPVDWQNVPESSLNTALNFEIGLQQKIGKRFTLEEKLSSNTILNKGISKNDLLRLGGLNSLRGFDQYFFYTSNFQLLNLNGRYFLDNNSSFLIINDWAYVNSQVQYAYSFGLGFDLKTKSGWFRLLYAAGKQKNQSLNISNGKVHFGYIALF